MKTFLILALLAIAATTATAVLRAPVPQLVPQIPSLQQPQAWFPWALQPFPSQHPYPQPPPFPQPQPFPPQQPFPQPQPFPPQQPYPQPPPFPQPQPFPPQQPFPQPQPFPPQQPYPQPQPFPPQPYPQLQCRISEQQGQQVPQQILQQFLQQQLMPCRDILLQQRNIAPARSQVLQQSNYQELHQQCCMQLWKIPEQSRCQAIHSVAQAIILQQQLQQYLSGQGSVHQPQLQYPSGQCSFQQSPQQYPQGHGPIQPQQIPQFDYIMNLALRTLPALCNVYVPPYCSTTTVPFGSIGAN